MLSLGSFTERNILHGLREQGLSVNILADLTAKERSFLHQRADPALNDGRRLRPPQPTRAAPIARRQRIQPSSCC